MRQRTIFLYGLLALILGGCMYPFGPGGVEPDPPAAEAATVTRTEIYTIHAPTINGMPYGYDGELVPGNRYKLNFAKQTDQYGNPAGLSDDRIWELFDVIIELPENTQAETIFWPTEHDRPAPPNLVHWFPGHRPGTDTVSGKPYPPMFVAGYPFSACDGLNLIDMQGQVGTLIAIAQIDGLRVRIECPEHTADGQYTLDIPGGTPQASNVFEYGFGEPGTYAVVWESTDSDAIAVHEFVIPVDWFWLRGEWPIRVGPTGICGALRHCPL